MDQLERELLNHFQRDFPLCSRPYAAIAAKLGVEEAEILAKVKSLQDRGVISRAGAVFAPKRAGASTLAALKVPPLQLEAIAEIINSYKEVNHNYEREHDYNLWFVIAAPNQAEVDNVIKDIEERTGLAVLNLPLEKEYFIDLGFRIQWN